MVKITFGTAGWDYKDWVGPFYPKKLDRLHHLDYFSTYFNLVEINSTFYNLPSEDMVFNWYNHVPQEFRFIVKVWQKITHELDSPEVSSRVYDFFDRINLLKEKLFACLLQFPPWFKYSTTHLEKLNKLLRILPNNYKYVIELRDNSWFQSDIPSKFIDGENVILGTTYMPRILPYYMENQKYYYIRLIGDRELNVFNRIRRDQKEAFHNLDENIEELKKLPNIYEIFIIVNNHFQGFAPESIIILKKKFGLSYRSLTNQKSLTDFIS